jgi:predicted DNA-binding protein
MDRRKLRFPEFDGDRLTVRLAYRDRTRLRAVADQLGVTESEIVREAVAVLLTLYEDPASLEMS